MQPQNIVINQVPLSHAIMTNVNATNGIPIATALQQSQVDQTGDVKPVIAVQTVPIAAGNLVGIQQGTVQAASPVKAVSQSGPVSASGDTVQLVTKTRLTDLVRDIDPNVYMEDEVEEALLTYVDDFVDRVLNGASLIAKHRHVNAIEVKDVQQFISTVFFVNKLILLFKYILLFKSTLLFLGCLKQFYCF